MGNAEQREVYFEFVAIGNAVRVSAICSVTGVEVQGIGPDGKSKLEPANSPTWVNRKMKLQAESIRSFQIDEAAQ